MLTNKVQTWTLQLLKEFATRRNASQTHRQLLKEIAAISTLASELWLQCLDNETLRFIRDALWAQKMTRKAA